MMDPRWRVDWRHVTSQPSKMVSFCRASEAYLISVNSFHHALTERNLRSGDPSTLPPTWPSLYHEDLEFSRLGLTGFYILRFFHNRLRSIYQYSNMASRLSGQTSIIGVVFFVSKSFLGIKRQRQLKWFKILTRKPLSHVRILIYRTRLFSWLGF